MKRFLGLFFVFILVVGVALIVGCNSVENIDQAPTTVTSAETTVAVVTTSAQTTVPAETTVCTTTTQVVATTPAPPASVAVAASGKSDYIVVYDGNDRTIAAAVSDFASKVKAKFGFTLTSSPVSSVSTKSEYEIVVGGARDSGKALAEKLEWKNDFAIGIDGSAINLCATNEVSYNYLFEYLLNEGFEKNDENVTLEVDGTFLYSTSSISNMSYPDFHRKYSGTCEQDFMLKCFYDGTFKGSNGLSMKYRLYVPSNYDPSKEYPVIFFLHGAGHRGTDNAAPVKGIIFNLFNHKNPQIDDAIVLVPQCPSNYQWVDWPWAKGSYSVDAIPESKAMKTALELLDKVEREYSTDTDRYYAFGLSMGGFGTWDVIMRHPDRFAAAVTLCGGADPTKAAVLVDMPIWTVHSLDDTSVPVKGTQEMVKAIKDAGGTKIVYDELNGYNHSIGTLTAKRDEVFEWMFSQSK